MSVLSMSDMSWDNGEFRGRDMLRSNLQHFDALIHMYSVAIVIYVVIVNIIVDCISATASKMA